MKINFLSKSQDLNVARVIKLNFTENQPDNDLYAKAAVAQNCSGKMCEQISYLENNQPITFLSLGNKHNWNHHHARKVGDTLGLAMLKSNPESIHLIIEDVEYAEVLLQAFYLMFWEFDNYKSRNKKTIRAKEVYITTNKSTEEKIKQILPILDGTHLARTLSNMPANLCDPEFLAQQASELDEKYEKLQVKILDEKEMKDLGMNSLLGVGQGSRKESKLIVIEYKGDSDNANFDTSIVGKGITFDTGGISIKPSNNMHEMKHDMSGAAVVMGFMRGLAETNIEKNIVGIMAVAENMCDGDAQRPGDVVIAADGQTIEILNTDAEGRLVLADALWYAQKYYDPEYIIDYATLTGAVIVALGGVQSAIYCKDNHLTSSFIKAGNQTGELVWHMPLNEDYSKAMNSPIADMQNISKPGFGAGSITAAAFLQRFIDADRKWCHLDIAGVSNANQPKFSSAYGATGYGVNLTYRAILNLFNMQ